MPIDSIEASLWCLVDWQFRMQSCAFISTWSCKDATFVVLVYYLISLFVAFVYLVSFSVDSTNYSSLILDYDEL